MWRFLHNIPRALKNYHGPRASVGVIVDNDDKDKEQVSDIQDNDNSKKCVLLQTHQLNSYNVYSNDRQARTLCFLQSLLAQKGQPCNQSSDQGDSSKKPEARSYEQDCITLFQSYILPFFDGSTKQMLEALDVGPWVAGIKEQSLKLNLLHNFLYSLCITCNRDEISLTFNVKEDEKNKQEELPRLRSHTLCAIKDARGSEHDRAINVSKSETLEAALKEFEQMCEDYTAQNESYLALMAADNGEMCEAVQHFRSACSMGNKSACFNLGLCYETGNGVKKNFEKAKNYYGLASSKGHVQAMYNLSLLYLNEDGNNQDSLMKGNELMEKAAMAGLSQAQTHMGLYYMQEVGDAKKAAAYFKAAADQNDNEAKYFLALCFEHGQGVEVNECWAAYLYSSAANAGNDCAIFNLARFHENGLGGLPVNFSSAQHLYKKAASCGNKDAQTKLKELSAIKARKEQSMNKEEVEQNYRPTVKLKSSSSSPNLGEHLNNTLSRFLYQKLFELLYKSNNVKEKPMIESVGGIKPKSFYIGGDDLVDKEQITDLYKDVKNTGCINSEHKNNFLCKSSTTPDLSSLVACSI